MGVYFFVRAADLVMIRLIQLLYVYLNNLTRYESWLMGAAVVLLIRTTILRPKLNFLRLYINGYFTPGWLNWLTPSIMAFLLWLALNPITFPLGTESIRSPQEFCSTRNKRSIAVPSAPISSTITAFPDYLSDWPDLCWIVLGHGLNHKR